ncbi:MAG: hypothetical protein IPM64_17510 [Phycisphaerales bacterium]|nr:hypothetical protein [Phycisphaerales bacterium]
MKYAFRVLFSAALALAILAAPSAFAAPFVEANVDPAVTSCGVFLDVLPKKVIPVTAPVPPATQFKCREDVGSVAPGSHTISMTGILTNPAWGTLESDPSAPFGFVRPAAPSVPSNLQIVP